MLPEPVLRENRLPFNLRELVLTFWRNPVKFPDFGLAWGGRFTIILASFMFTTFRVLYMENHLGLEPGDAVRAVATATFHAAMPGLWIAPGKTHAGAVRVIDIGIPAGAPVEYESAFLANLHPDDRAAADAQVAAALDPRAEDLMRLDGEALGLK